MPTGRMYHAAHAATGPSRSSRPFGRRAVALTVSALATIALLPGSSQADPTPPELTIDQVQAKVDALYRELEIAAETANDAEVKADELRANLETLRSNLEHMADDLDAATDDAGMLAAAQYRSAGLDPSVQLLLTGADDDFLSRMSQLNQLADRQARTLGNLADAQDAMAQQEATIAREAARLAELEAVTAEAEAAADARLDEANALLERLTAEEAARLAAEEAARQAAAEEEARRAAAAAAAEEASASAPSTEQAQQEDGGTEPPPQSGPASGRAQIAVDTAMAQIGDSYVWGAEGPDSFDCSGLTSYAWRAAGVSLPHSSQAQMGSGTPVSSGDLQPGDLVFYYSPVSHVALYIGNGMIVHASRPGKPVGVADVFSMPYSGAVRVG